MPYIFREELSEGEVEADVVERSDYDAVITERDEIITQRDEAIVRAEAAEKGWEESRNKYADAFLSSPARVKQNQIDDTKRDGQMQTFSALFNQKEAYSAY